MGGVSFLEAAPIFKTNAQIGLWITLDENPENMFLLFLAFLICTFGEGAQTKHMNKTHEQSFNDFGAGFH